MVLHYCDIFSDCYRCPAPFCPYEKLDDGTDAGWISDEEAEMDEEDLEDGW